MVSHRLDQPPDQRVQVFVRVAFEIARREKGMAELDIKTAADAQHEKHRRRAQDQPTARRTLAQDRPGNEGAGNQGDESQNTVSQCGHAPSGGGRRNLPLASATIMPRMVCTSWLVRSARLSSARMWRIIGVSLLGG